MTDNGLNEAHRMGSNKNPQTSCAQTCPCILNACHTDIREFGYFNRMGYQLTTVL